MEDYRLEQSGQEVQNILDGAAMQVDLTAETERATEAEQTLQDNIDAEATRAQGAEGTLQDNIDAEETRAKAAEKQNADDIDAIEEKIPLGASSSNKLSTEEYVADAVATATATFRGTYNLVSDLHLNVTATEQQIAAALAGAISTADNNDYCFILVPTSSETPTEIKEIDRYKFNGTAWAFEYKLNNSGFTAAQWAAINSGITSGDVAKLAALPTNAQLTTLLAGLQSDIDGEEARAKAAELAIQGNIDAEETRAKAAEKQNADDIDAIEAVLPETASSENKVATKSETDSLSAAIEAILLLIPSAATSLNKLADKAFVNSSIATATATFRGTYNLVNDLGLTTSATHAQIATALAGAILTADNNDYAFVQIPTSDAMPTEIAKTERYKFNGSAWEYEYDLNNSGFTADQWAAINSGITQALVTKLSDLPTNAQLTTELGTLTSGITTINQKIPNAASQANKLVDTAAMESYIVEVLNVLTISYNVTSTDGHVTFHIEQVDGKITSVTLTTSDIASAADLNLKASQADLTALASRVTTAECNITTLGGRMTTAEGNITSLGGRMTTAEGNITTINGNITSLGGRMTTAEGNITTINGNITSLDGRISTNETDIANLQQLYNNLQQSKPVPVTALPETGQQQGVIYRLAGTTSYSDYMWNGSTWVLMATYNNAIDPRPKKASQNLVTSGGVFDNMGALDISELNVTENPHTLAQYVDLSAALAAIPTDYQKGGMSIKFVRSSDNKYVQARCISDEFTTNEELWAIMDGDIYTENPEFLEVKTDAEGKLYEGTKKNGNKYFPKDVEIKGKIINEGLDETLSHLYFKDNPEWLDVVIDKEEKIISGIKKDGSFWVKNKRIDNQKDVTKKYPDTIIVAAYDSTASDKEIADYVCSGFHDEVIINKAIDDLVFGGVLQLCYGTYNIDSFQQVQGYLFWHAIGVRDNGNFRNVLIKGMPMTVYVYGSSTPFKGPTIRVTENCFNALDNNTRVAVIGCASAKEWFSFRCAFSVEDILISYPNCTKPIVGVSHIHTAIGGCKNVSIENDVTCDIMDNHAGTQAPTPNPLSVGFYGHSVANTNLYSKYEHCVVVGCAVGFEIGGDHNMIENCTTSRNIIGYSNGIVSQNTHHNTYINCCSESDTQFMRFGDNLESPVLEPIQIINFQIEQNPNLAPDGSAVIPDLVGNKMCATEANPNSQWVGDITYSCAPYDTAFFESGQGHLFKVRNMRNKISGTSNQKPQHPNFLEEFFNMDENKNEIFNGSEWV